jgi:hypothetical protein
MSLRPRGTGIGVAHWLYEGQVLEVEARAGKEEETGE